MLFTPTPVSGTGQALALPPQGGGKIIGSLKGMGIEKIIGSLKGMGMRRVNAHHPS